MADERTRQDLKNEIYDKNNTIYDLKQRLEDAHRRVARLEVAKLKVNKVVRRSDEMDIILEVIEINETDNGVIVVVW